MATESVTLLFTDVVGSTAIRARLGEDAAEALRRDHVSSLRAGIDAHGGAEVKTLGDGIMAVFTVPSAALDAAADLQRRVTRHRRTAPAALEIRIGVSSGECDVDDGDYHGLAVVEAARLCDRAEGGEILVSDLTRALVGGRGGRTFVPVGPVELKGMPQATVVHRLDWAPIEADPGSVPFPARLRAEDVVGFVGRRHARGITDGAWDAVVAGSRRVVLVAGEPGIGKTRLAAEVARATHEKGAIVLYGRCDEDLGTAYQPFVDALSALDAVVAPDDSSSDDPRLVGPGLGGAGSADPADQYRLFGAVSRQVRSATEIAPVVLVIDDLHWATRPTLQLLRHLVIDLVGERVLVVGTYRDTEVAGDHPLAGVLAALRREPGIDRVALAGLSVDEMVEVVERASGHDADGPMADLAQRLLSETRGNPFFATEILRHLAEVGDIAAGGDGRWRITGAVADIGVPESVREVVGERVARLGRDATGVLGAAAVLGRDFDADTVAAVADAHEDEVAAAVDAAVGAALVTAAPGDLTRFTFAHALVEHTLYQGLAPLQRQGLHRRAAAALEAADAPAAEVAAHLLKAARPSDLQRTLAAVRRAGDEALAALAPDEAVRWYRRGVELGQERSATDPRARTELAVLLGVAQRAAGDPDFRATLLAAGRAARDLGATDLLVQAALANTRGFVSEAGVVDHERVGLIEAALAALGDADSPERARLLALLVSERTYDGEADERVALAEEAVALARRLDDPRTLLGVLRPIGLGAETPDTLDRRLRWAAEARDLADRHGDDAERFWTWTGYATVATHVGDVATVAATNRLQADVAHRLGEPTMRWVATWGQANAAVERGELAAAEELIEQALVLGEATGQPDAFVFYSVQLLALRAQQGRLAELREVVAEAARANPTLPGYRAWWAAAEVMAGDPARARSLLEAELAEGFPIAWDNLWLLGHHAWSTVAAALGSPAACEALVQRLAPYADQVVSIGSITLGSVAGCLGPMLLAGGRPSDARHHLGRAVASAVDRGVPYEEALAEMWLGRVALVDAADDPRPHLARAVALAEGHGYSVVALGASAPTAAR